MRVFDHDCLIVCMEEEEGETFDGLVDGN